MKLLEVQNLTKHFGGLTAVNELSFDVLPGEIRALIGPNGAGKTTVFQLISGFLKPSSGSILFNGTQIDSAKPYKRALLGLGRTFQKGEAFGNMTVLENVMAGEHKQITTGFIAAGLRLSRVKAQEMEYQEKAIELTEFVGLTDRINDFASDLPYGAQRMLEIGRALASQPSLLMMDEPAAGLSAAETEVLASKIVAIREQGVSVLLIEHNMGLIMKISDRVSVLNYGRKIAEGVPSAIKTNQQVIESYLGKGFTQSSRG